MNETALVPKSLGEAKALANTLAAAEIVGALYKKPADILAIIMTGVELGLSPMQSVRGIQIIRGCPTLSADAMGALVKRHPGVCEYLIVRELTENACVIETKRKGEPEAQRHSFTREDARIAGLLGGENWRKYPKAMLHAHCLAGICRSVYPDLVPGMCIPEELEGAQHATEATVPPPKPTAQLEATRVTLVPHTSDAIGGNNE